MSSEERLAEFIGFTETLMDEPASERFVRDLLSRGMNSCPLILLKEIADLVAEHQQQYLDGEIDGDGLPTY